MFNLNNYNYNYIIIISKLYAWSDERFENVIKCALYM